MGQRTRVRGGEHVCSGGRTRGSKAKAVNSWTSPGQGWERPGGLRPRLSLSAKLPPSPFKPLSPWLEILTVVGVAHQARGVADRHTEELRQVDVSFVQRGAAPGWSVRRTWDDKMPQ